MVVVVTRAVAGSSTTARNVDLSLVLGGGASIHAAVLFQNRFESPSPDTRMPDTSGGCGEGDRAAGDVVDIVVVVVVVVVGGDASR